MTKRHYEMIAEALNYSRQIAIDEGGFEGREKDIWVTIVGELSDLFDGDNHRFDADMFSVACYGDNS